MNVNDPAEKNGVNGSTGHNNMGPPLHKPSPSIDSNANSSNSCTPTDGVVKSFEPSSDSTNTSSSANTLPVSSESQGDTPEPPLPHAPSYWGYLCSLQSEFFNIDLVNDQYLFGRAKACDYCFDIPSIKSNKYHKSYSKKHFKIERILDPTTLTTRVILVDLGGTNGTFVNGKKVNSNNQQQLHTLDKIALSYPWNKVFLYVDCQTSTSLNLPAELSNKYIMGKSIGKGACGEVYEIFLREGVGQFACKVISKTLLSLSDKDHNRNVMIEAQILQKLHHPCIIAIQEVFDSTQNLYILLEYAAGGELFERLHSKGPMPEPLAKLYFYQMLNAVSYLHENKITHRDLKPENILLLSKKEPCLIKITDFGMSRLVNEKSLMETQAGTPSYLAPEIVSCIQSRSSQGYTKLVDMWSLGVILYVCLVAYPPFSNERNDTDEDIYDQIVTANYNFNHSRWKNVSQLAKQLISFLLKLNSSERLNTDQALDHSWLDDRKMIQEANELMEPYKSVLERSLMEEKSLSNDSYDTRKISTDMDGESTKSSFGKSDSDESLSSPSKRVRPVEDQDMNVKHAKLS